MNISGNTFERFYNILFDLFETREWKDKIRPRKLGQLNLSVWAVKDASGAYIFPQYFKGDTGGSGHKYFYGRNRAYVIEKNKRNERNDRTEILVSLDDRAYFKALLYIGIGVQLNPELDFYKLLDSGKLDFMFSINLLRDLHLIFETQAFSSIYHELNGLDTTENFQLPGNNTNEHTETAFEHSRDTNQYQPPFSELLLGPFNILPKNVKIKVHSFTQFEGTSIAVNSHFDQINAGREKPFYSSLRYRIIAYKWEMDQLWIHVAPATFKHAIVYRKYKEKAEIQEYYGSRMKEQSEALKKLEGDTSLIYNDSAFVILGIESCILTSDHYCYIRKRGNHMSVQSNKWAGAITGTVGNSKMVYKGFIDITASLISDLTHKVSELISADITALKITGLHHNTQTEAIDILCYWHLDITAEQLLKYLANSECKIGVTFNSVNEPNDTFLHETLNLIFPINKEEQEECFLQNGIRHEEFVPESLKAMQLAFNHLRH